MPHPNFILLYVDAPLRSAEFYADLLETPAIESSETFAMFALESGMMLGLWARHTVQPLASTTTSANGELAFAVDSAATVERMHQAWQTKGLPIAQAPCNMDFGYTFVALDPDGHRLRVFVPQQG
jgi:predicted lactoylglutathione lyase